MEESTLAAWRPVSTGRDKDWKASLKLPDGSYHTGAARIVEFSRHDDPYCTIIIRVYPAWYGDEPSDITVYYTWDWIRGESAADLPGTKTWSSTGGGTDRGGYRDETVADNRARYLAGLLSQASFRDLARAAPGMCESALGWDGIQPEADDVLAAA